MRLLRFSQLRRKIGRTAGRLLRFAAEFEKLASQVGHAQVAGGTMGVVGGLMAVLGLALAPLTAGGSLALTGLAMGLSAGGGGAMVMSAVVGMPAEIAGSQWEKHYLGRAVDESNDTLAYCDFLAGVLSEALVAFDGFENYLEEEDAPIPREVLDGLLWVKNVYVSIFKAYKFAKMSQRVEILNEVIHVAKKVSKAVAEGVDRVEVKQGGQTVKYLVDLSKYERLFQKIKYASHLVALYDPSGLCPQVKKKHDFFS